MNVHIISRVKFYVTAENIKEACKADSRHCVIAEAIATQLPNARNISVDMMTIRWSDPTKGWRYVYLTPKPAQRALIDFDMGETIEPFSFQVRSGHAVPMILGTGNQRKRAHKVSKGQILKATDKGTVIKSIGRESVPMWPADKDCSVAARSQKRTPVNETAATDKYRAEKGRPKVWHPSHNSLRKFGYRGFTEDYVKRI